MRADIVEPSLVVANNLVELFIINFKGPNIAVLRSGSQTFKLAIKGFEGGWVRVAIDTNANEIVIIYVVTRHVVTLVDFLHKVWELCVKNLSLGVDRRQSECAGCSSKSKEHLISDYN